MYLYRTTRATILHPDVVEVEGDESEDGDVKENLPAREKTAIAVDRRCQTCRIGGSVEDQSRDISQLISVTEFVGEEDSNVKDPSGNSSMFLG